jgi:hypothetical protein
MALTETAFVAVRHIVSVEFSGGFVTPKQRTTKFYETQFQLARPATAKEPAELRCAHCSGELLVEVRSLADTRRVRTVTSTLAALSAVLFVVCLVLAIHFGSQTLPEGQSMSPLLPVGAIGAFVFFVAAPTFYAYSRAYNGVILWDAPKPKRLHRILPGRPVRPVRPAVPPTPSDAIARP